MPCWDQPEDSVAHYLVVEIISKKNQGERAPGPTTSCNPMSLQCSLRDIEDAILPWPFK